MRAAKYTDRYVGQNVVFIDSLVEVQIFHEDPEWTELLRPPLVDNSIEARIKNGGRPGRTWVFARNTPWDYAVVDGILYIDGESTGLTFIPVTKEDE